MSCNLFRWNCARYVPLAPSTKRFAPEAAPAIPGARVLLWRHGEDHLGLAGPMRLILSVSILPVVDKATPKPGRAPESSEEMVVYSRRRKQTTVEGQPS